MSRWRFDRFHDRAGFVERRVLPFANHSCPALLLSTWLVLDWAQTRQEVRS